MIVLILGVALWWAAHSFKRFAPARRAAMGDAGRGLVAGAVILSVLLMIWGYKMANGPVWWGPTPALKGINNLLVLAAFYLFAAAGMKTAITRRLRHPQLLGFSLWAAGHLLVNGDLPSFILFGGLLCWALVSMVVINKAQPGWTPATTGPISMRKEAMAALGALVSFAIVGLIHGWLGYNPFGA